MYIVIVNKLKYDVGGEDCQPQQFLVQTTFSSLSRRSHLEMLALLTDSDRDAYFVEHRLWSLILFPQIKKCLVKFSILFLSPNLQH